VLECTSVKLAIHEQRDLNRPDQCCHVGLLQE
jgi:hypothetical protein